MKRLFLPAIFFMNQLGLQLKFLVINIVFAVPLVLLSYGFWAQLNDGIKTTSSEIQGLTLLQGVYGFAKASEAYRDSYSVDSTRDKTLLGQKTPLNKKRVEESLMLLEEMAVKQKGQEVLVERLAEVRSMWRRVANISGATNHAMIYSGFSDFARQSAQLLDMVAQTSGLSRDPNVETVSLLRVLTELVPKVTHSLSEARSYGTYAATNDYMGSGLADDLDRIYDAITASAENLQQTTAVVVSNSPQLKAELGDVVDSSHAAILDSQVFLEDKIILASSLDYPAGQYYDEQTRLLDKVYGFVDSAIPVINVLLEERLAEQKQQVNLLFFALAVVYITIIFLFGGFYLSITDSFRRFIDAAGKIAEGDMTVSIDLKSKDEVQELANEFNAMSSKVRELISEVLVVSSDVSTKSQDVEGIAEKSSNAIERQLSETAQVTTAMNQMADTVQDVAQNSSQAAGVANKANEEAAMGQKVVETTLSDVNSLAQEIDTSASVINRVAEDSNNISQVLDVIKGIAEQTNLLALNAAIEAARAGEQGRGFAVVADEVRTLAQRTHQSTEEIEQMINRLQSGVGDAVKTMEISHEMASRTVERSGKVGDALVNIVQAVNDIVGMNNQIATAAEEQSAIAGEINHNIQRINEVGQETATGAADTNKASHEMTELVSTLQGLVNAFKV